MISCLLPGFMEKTSRLAGLGRLVLSQLLISLCLLVSWSSQLKASTYIGNGGNVFEAEVKVTLEQIKNSLAIVANKLDEELCECSENTQGPLCDHLESLAEGELKACRKFLTSHWQSMRAGITNVNVELTDESISHGPQGGHRRQAGAVGPDALIVINQDDFIDLASENRVMLLTHELGHLLKVDGAFLSDSSQYEGVPGHVVLDAVGASVAAIGIQHGVISQREAARSSKAYRKYWFSLNFGNFGLATGDRTESLPPRNLATQELGLRYQHNDWLGLQLGHHTSENTHQRISWRSKLSLRKTKLAASLRYIPFGGRTDFWGQVHVLLQPGIAQTRYQHDLSDRYVKLAHNDQSANPFLDLRLLLPLTHRFWLEATYGVARERFESAATRMHLTHIATIATLGVSYGL